VDGVQLTLVVEVLWMTVTEKAVEVLDVWSVSPEYFAVMLWDPSVPDAGVNVTVQVAVVLFIVVNEEHVPKLVAALSRKKLTPPVGATDAPGETSLIVAVQGLFEPTGTVFELHAMIGVVVL